MKKVLKVLSSLVSIIFTLTVIMFAIVVVFNVMENNKYNRIPKNFSIELNSPNGGPGNTVGSISYIDKEKNKLYICFLYSNEFLNRKVYIAEENISAIEIKRIEDIFETEEDFRDDEEYKKSHTIINQAIVDDDWYKLTINGKEKYIKADKVSELLMYVGDTNYSKQFYFR